jgi:hypothetical protein
MPFNPVIMRGETVMFPTYSVGAPDKNPMFLEKRVYPGSSGKAYPLPTIASIADEKQDREYKIYCRYLMGLGLHGLGDRDAGDKALLAAAALAPNHQGELFAWREKELTSTSPQRIVCV